MPKDAQGHGSNGRGGAKPIPGHAYHGKSRAELQYIAKDAAEAAHALRGHDPRAEGKYADQVNDAHTVLGYRDRNGITDEQAKAALHSGTSKSDTAPVHPASGGGFQPGPTPLGHFAGTEYYGRASSGGKQHGGVHGPHATREAAAKQARAAYPRAKTISTARGVHGMDIQFHK